MSMKSQDRPDLFAHPGPETFDYRGLLMALQNCRHHVMGLMSETGPRNSMYVEAEWLIAYIDTVARLTRIPGATKFVRSGP